MGYVAEKFQKKSKVEKAIIYGKEACEIGVAVVTLGAALVAGYNLFTDSGEEEEEYDAYAEYCKRRGKKDKKGKENDKNGMVKRKNNDREDYRKRTSIADGIPSGSGPDSGSNVRPGCIQGVQESGEEGQDEAEAA